MPVPSGFVSTGTSGTLVCSATLDGDGSGDTDAGKDERLWLFGD